VKKDHEIMTVLPALPPDSWSHPSSSFVSTNCPLKNSVWNTPENLLLLGGIFMGSKIWAKFQVSLETADQQANAGSAASIRI
jgi:hypothetical protein